MNQLTFMYGQAQVRTTTINGQVHWVAKDVCGILEFANHSETIKRLDEDEVNSTEVIDSMGRSQLTNCVTESGLYSLILGSRKDEAKAFKRWVTHEVLPQIRKHGTYMTAETIEKTLSDPDFIIRLATELKTERAEKELLMERAKENAPKVALYEVAMCAGNDQSISKVAKSLNYGPNKLFKLLREKKVLFGTTPYQRYIDAGYFTVRQVPITRTDSIMNVTQPLVTPKGIAWIHKLLQEGETA